MNKYHPYRPHAPPPLPCLLPPSPYDATIIANTASSCLCNDAHSPEGRLGAHVMPGASADGAQMRGDRAVCALGLSLPTHGLSGRPPPRLHFPPASLTLQLSLSATPAPTKRGCVLSRIGGWENLLFSLNSTGRDWSSPPLPFALCALNPSLK